MWGLLAMKPTQLQRKYTTFYLFLGTNFIEWLDSPILGVDVVMGSQLVEFLAVVGSERPTGISTQAPKSIVPPYLPNSSILLMVSNEFINQLVDRIQSQEIVRYTSTLSQLSYRDRFSHRCMLLQSHQRCWLIPR